MGDFGFEDQGKLGGNLPKGIYKGFVVFVFVGKKVSGFDGVLKLVTYSTKNYSYLLCYQKHSRLYR